MQQTLTQIVKRDGTIVPFNENNIRNALVLCFSAIGKEPSSGFDELVNRVCAAVKAKHGTSDLVTVESVQDCVEYVLQADNEFEASKAYILFRAERNRVRTNNNEYIPFEVQKVFDDSAKYFPTQLQQFQFFDKYSKYNYDLGRRETWVETVDRVVSFLYELASPYADLGGETYRRIRQAILEFRVMPSMRLMAMAGPAARRDNLTIYNCSYLPVDSLSSFEEALHISMAGCGVGFSVESREVLKLPEIAKQRSRYRDTYTVEDTAEGWADALMYGLSTWFDGDDVLFDFSNIRLAGAPLRTKGGRSSGPEPLMAFLEFARKRILTKQGTRLSTLDAHDIMCAVGSAAVAGGVRRTAMISIFDIDDYDMLHCKDGDFAVENKQRWNANNSVVIERRLSQQEILNLVHTMTKDNRGEPGIFSRINAQNTAPERRVTDGVLFGTNPCFAPDTIIETIDGPKKICDITEPTFVYSMDHNKKLVIRMASQSWITRKNAHTIKIYLSNGKSLIVTPEHKIYVDGKGWVQAKDLKWRDRLVGFCRTRRGSQYSGVKLTTQHRNEYQMEHKFIWSSLHGKIPVGYDIHHRNNNTYDNSYDNFELMSHSAHSTLTRRSVPNNHQVRDETGKFISSELSMGGYKPIIDMPNRLRSSWHQYATVEAIEEGPITDVYDISVDETNNLIANGVVAHNCGEINLNPRQLCNLSAAINGQDVSPDQLIEAVEIATIIGTIQSLATYFPNLSRTWKDNCERERLLGVDITGQRDNVNNLTPIMMQYLQATAIDINKQVADTLGINQSASVTCVKPSGNTSVLVDCSSGLHARWAKYYIKNIRASANSPLVKAMKDAGMPMSYENGGDKNTVVIPFVIKSPDGAITRHDLTALDQLEWWARNKINYTEHNPSVSITYKPDEVIDVAKWLYDHQNIIGGISIFPAYDGNYEQLPWVEISEEEYNKRKAQIPEINWANVYLYEKSDMTTAAQEVACTAGVCEA